MAVKIKKIWDDIISFDNLYLAYKNARRNKRYRSEILKFSSDVEKHLFDLHEELKTKTYKAGKYREFYIYDPKKRLIMALPFRDRVVQWAVYQKINSIFMKGYITDSYACITGRGVHTAVARLHYWLRLLNKKTDKKWYYQKLDFTKYFYRISHEVLIDIFEKKIKDKDLLWYLKETIHSEEMPFGLPLDRKSDEVAVHERLYDVGMPIGSLMSQMFANIYLNELDQYAKRHLGIKYYIRYMDDIIILHDDKRELKEIKDKVESYAKEVLRLDINDKSVLRPVSLGIDFCGYKVWNNHIKLRKSTALRMKRYLKLLKKKYARGEIDYPEIKQVLVSYHGILKHCDSRELRNKIYKDLVLKREN